MSNCKICQYESKNGHALDCPKRVKRSYKETLELVERVAKRESGSTECTLTCHGIDWNHGDHCEFKPKTGGRRITNKRNSCNESGYCSQPPVIKQSGSTEYAGTPINCGLHQCRNCNCVWLDPKPASPEWEESFDKEFETYDEDGNYMTMVIYSRREIKSFIRNLLSSERELGRQEERERFGKIMDMGLEEITRRLKKL